MPVPDYESLMLPLMESIADGNEHAVRDVREAIAKKLKLTEADRAELLPSGSQALFDNRLGWAKTYLKKAELLHTPRRAICQLTKSGLAMMKTKPDRITNETLKELPAFRAFWNGEKKNNSVAAHDADPHAVGETPHESIEGAYRRLRDETESALLEAVRNASPAFFERLVVQLLVSMGYGGSVEDAGRALVTGRSGDGGIDGLIKEDALGLDAVYVQAKRWQSNVGRPEVQAFAGSLEGERARKGVLITTSNFSKDAKDYVSRIDKRIVLIDGATLAGLMFQYGVGVNTVSAYEVKRVDGDYFEEG